MDSDDVARLAVQNSDLPKGQDSQLRVLVAERIVGHARDELKKHGRGWLDLRGRLFLSAPGVLVDAEVPAFRSRPERTSPFSGPAGLEVACALLMEPDSAPTVRGLARALSRAPSTVSDVLKGLRAEGLLRGDGTPTIPELFWATAEAWPSRAVPLTSSPDAIDSRYAATLRLGLDDSETKTGWALTDTLGAAAYGAPWRRAAITLQTSTCPTKRLCAEPSNSLVELKPSTAAAPRYESPPCQRSVPNASTSVAQIRSGLSHTLCSWLSISPRIPTVAARFWRHGNQGVRGVVSGSETPTVGIVGKSMFEIVQAIPDVERRTKRPVTVVGGLAVMCRLTQPYRATSDLDTVNRRADGEPAQLQVLIASGGEQVGPARVYLQTPAGRVQIDVLEVADWELDNHGCPTQSTTPYRATSPRSWH